jgi:hypothetical protein
MGCNTSEWWLTLRNRLIRLIIISDKNAFEIASRSLKNARGAILTVLIYDFSETD